MDSLLNDERKDLYSRRKSLNSNKKKINNRTLEDTFSIGECVQKFHVLHRDRSRSNPRNILAVFIEQIATLIATQIIIMSYFATP